VVPGHGPLARPEAVADLKGYFEWLGAEARVRFEGGLTPLDAARDIDLGRYDEWQERERLVVNVQAFYRDFGAELPWDTVTVFGAMAALEAHPH
jgi:cyclase